MSEEVNIKETLKRNATLIAAVVILSILFLAVFRPQVSTLLSLRGELASLKEKLRSSHEMIDNLVHVAYEYEEAASRVAAIKRYYPGEKDRPEVLRSIITTADELGLKIQTIEPQPEEPGRFLTRVPRRITLEGDIRSFAEYLERISNVAKLLDIRNIEISQDPSVYPRTKIDILLNAYFISEGTNK